MKDIIEATKQIFKSYIDQDKRGLCIYIFKMNQLKYRGLPIMSELRNLYYKKYNVVL